MREHFRVNEPDVTFESFDEEVLAINLRNGNYYSLRESAVPVWQLVVRRFGIGEIGRQLARSTGADESSTTATIRNFVEELAGENLLVPLSDSPPAPGDSAPVSMPSTFANPILDRYTDMQQLLLMDPIHEVDVTGWPARAPQKDSS